MRRDGDEFDDLLSLSSDGSSDGGSGDESEAEEALTSAGLGRLIGLAKPEWRLMVSYPGIRPPK